MSSVVSQISKLRNLAKHKHHRKVASEIAQSALQRRQSRYPTADPDHVPESEFIQGIQFDVKLIGSLDIPRPTTRVEIVAAMRRVRYEFKSKGIGKRDIRLKVSVDGVVTLLKKSGPGEVVVKEHPIYRIFYVSHDTQDVKIFSYIARESNSNLFHCCVYKAKRKKQALRIVKTIGQAFEVVHRMRPRLHGGEEEQGSQDNAAAMEKRNDEDTTLMQRGSRGRYECEDAVPAEKGLRKGRRHRAESAEGGVVGENPSHADYTSTLLLNSNKQSTLERASLKSQVNLLRDQLRVETEARIEAQNRVEELLVHNQELLLNLEKLVSHLNEIESRKEVTGSSNCPPEPGMAEKIAEEQVPHPDRDPSCSAGADGGGDEKLQPLAAPPSRSPIKREVNFELNLPTLAALGEKESSSPHSIHRSVSEKSTKSGKLLDEVKRLASKQWARHTTK